MKKGAAVIALGVAAAGAAVVMFGQYCTGDSAFCDSAGNFVGWLKNLMQKAKNAAQNTAGAVTGSDGASAFDQALDLIAGFEGFRSKAYTDAAGYLTIGYGHKIVQGDGFDASSEISESDARTLLEQDASGALECVENNVAVETSSQQEAALISLCYNIGCGAFAGSTLLRDVNSQDWSSAINEFGKWIYANKVQLPALISRRQNEADYFAAGTITGVDTTQDNA